MQRSDMTISIGNRQTIINYAYAIIKNNNTIEGTKNET